MATMDLLLEQGLILIGLGLVGVMMLVVVVLMLVPRVKVMQENRRKQAEERALLAAAELQTGEEPDAESDDRPSKPSRPGRVQPVTNPEKTTTPAAAVAAAPPVKTIPMPPAVPAAAPQAEAKPTGDPSAPSSAMQDLLNSVFVDEEAIARYNLLMEGHEPVKAETLARFASEIANQMHEMAR